MLNFNDLDTYLALVDAAGSYGVDPSSSIESEDFFRALLETYEGSNDPIAIKAWLVQKIQNLFIAINERPVWLQTAQWPIEGGKPMVFVGQLDLNYETATLSSLFHDCTSFYIFVATGTSPVVVVQQT